MKKAAKVLVVDDEMKICENVEKILSKNNYEVVHAQSAKEALDKMTKDSFSLLISDIIMPEMNGLELLRLTKEQWPLIKVMMMTAYASTDTAVKAIRLGALDYVPKPFTPDELRAKVNRVLTEELAEAPITKEERKTIEVIDADIPFDRAEVAKYTGEEYADMLGPSDMPVIEEPAPETLENYCVMGEMVCDIFKKLGNTCKGGVKTSECPQKKAKKKKAAKGKKAVDTKKLIGVDQPFDYEEVVAVTGPEYVRNLHHDGVVLLPYEELKKNVAGMMTKERNVIDSDIPFDRDEVAKYTGAEYADQLGPSDMPIMEEAAPETLEGYCLMGEMVCDIFKKLGNTCKGGVKTSECPQKKAKKKKAAKGKKAIDTKKLIGIDQPFDYKEVVSVTGPEYVQNLHQDGIAFLPYEELKKNVARMMAKQPEVQPAYHEVMQEPAHKNILVIDDEVAVNNNIRKILAKKGYHVDQATTKDEALQKIGEGAYKLILLDLKIPGVKGLELLETIRDKRPESRVIIITGYASIETAVETTRLGAIDYVAKPFTPDEIRNATENAFQLAA